MARKTAKQSEQDRIEKIVERTYYATCSGVAISVMDIGKVFKFGVQACKEGKDLQVELPRYVASLAWLNSLR
jgi:hypothetical protein